MSLGGLFPGDRVEVVMATVRFAILFCLVMAMGCKTSPTGWWESVRCVTEAGVTFTADSVHFRWSSRSGGHGFTPHGDIAFQKCAHFERRPVDG